MGSNIDNHLNAAAGKIPFLKINNDLAIAVDQLGCVAKGTLIKVIDSIAKDGVVIYANNQHYREFIPIYKKRRDFRAAVVDDLLRRVKLSNKEAVIYRDLTIQPNTQDQVAMMLAYVYQTTKDNVLEIYESVKHKLQTEVKSFKPFAHEPTEYSGYYVSRFNTVWSINDMTFVDHYDPDGDEFEPLFEVNVLGKVKVKPLVETLFEEMPDTAFLNQPLEDYDVIYKDVPIEDVQIGDIVPSMDKHGNKIITTVSSVHRVEVPEEDRVAITTYDGMIRTSSWHPTPYYDANTLQLETMRADAIRPGDLLYKDSGFDIVLDVSKDVKCKEYYDLTVQNTNMYYSRYSRLDSYLLTHNTRKGAVAVYIEPWDLDIENFLKLKNNSGDEYARTHDLFPAIWINDLFMERVELDEDWTLFDPDQAGELHTLYGDEFKKRYLELEQSPNIRKKVVKAKTIWKTMLREYFETGSPFFTFKDEANRRNPNGHGVIRSSNLCTEIFEETDPGRLEVHVIKSDGSIDKYDADEIVTLQNSITKRAEKLIPQDFPLGSVVSVEKKIVDDKIAICNLASINLSKIHTEEDIKRVTKILVRALSNVVKLNYAPVAAAKINNLKTNAIGIGVMGEAELIATKGIEYGSQEHKEFIDEIMEMISYYTIDASIELAQERGVYPEYPGSNWSKGILPIDTANENAKKLTKRSYKMDWEALRTKLLKYGIHNGYLMAIAPTSTISLITGTSPTIEAIYKHKWYEVNLSGDIPVTAPGLTVDNYHIYKPVREIDPIDIVELGAIRQKWIDQGQSLNINVDPEKVTGKLLNEIYMSAWKLGLKSTYYLRSNSTIVDTEDTHDIIDRSIECSGCQ